MKITAPIGTLIILGLMLIAVTLIAPVGSDRPGWLVQSETNMGTAQNPQDGLPYLQPMDESAKEGWEAQKSIADTAIVQAFLTGIGILLIWRTLVATKDATREAAAAAQAAADTVGAMQRSERAYVTISHKPPGLLLHPSRKFATVIVTVKNDGRTPATVSDVHLELKWFKSRKMVHAEPTYQRDESISRVGGFLVANSHFSKEIKNLPIPDHGKADELWLFGYVDYSDVFGQSHRGGYARIFREDEPNNNLVFPRIHGWNYDRQRPMER